MPDAWTERLMWSLPTWALRTRFRPDRIAHEPRENHHRRVGACVLFADGRVQRLKSDEFQRVVTTDKPE